MLRGIWKLAVFFIFIAQTGLIAGGDEDWAKVKETIQKINDKYEAAMLSGDFSSMAGYYDSEAYSLPNFGKMLKGSEEILQHSNEMASTGIKFTSVSFETIEVFGSGNLAVEVGKYTMNFVMPQNEQEMSDTGKYVTVWRKQSDGSWKTLVETWNTDTEMMGM